jgi:hypothetical protein
MVLRPKTICYDNRDDPSFAKLKEKVFARVEVILLHPDPPPTPTFLFSIFFDPSLAQPAHARK